MLRNMGGGAACGDADRASAYGHSSNVDAFNNHRATDHNDNQCGGTISTNTKHALFTSDAAFALDSSNPAGAVQSTKWNNADRPGACTWHATGRINAGERSWSGDWSMRSEHGPECIRLNCHEFALGIDRDELALRLNGDQRHVKLADIFCATFGNNSCNTVRARADADLYNNFPSVKGDL
ncbi:MAG: hypothetical protein ACRD3B_12405 [Candidatus Sulfotelmatobacter sp.]